MKRGVICILGQTKKLFSQLVCLLVLRLHPIKHRLTIQNRDKLRSPTRYLPAQHLGALVDVVKSQVPNIFTVSCSGC
jgi:hypothetical protein